MPQGKSGHELDLSQVEPHPGQRRVLDSAEQYPVTLLSPGRQFGKSSVRPFWILETLARTPGFATLAYMGPQHADAKKAFEEDLVNLGAIGVVKDHGGDDQDRHIDYHPIQAEYRLDHLEPDGSCRCVCPDCARIRRVKKRLKGRANEGGRIYYASGAPTAHRLFQKHKLHGAFLDEFSHIDFAAWYETIRPMFNTTGGHALIVGTPIPDGINFTGFGELFQMGVKGSDTYNPRYNSISGKSEDNPYANHDEIAEQRADLAKMGKHSLAACLYDGLFAADMGAVFTNLDKVFCLRGVEVSKDLWVYREPEPGEDVVVSIDFGRHDDSTVVSAISRWTMEQLAVQRIRETEYLVQLPMIDKFIRRYDHPQIWAEGRDETAAELLRKQYGDACNLVKWASGGKFDKSSCVAVGMDLCQRGAWKLIKWPAQSEEFRIFMRTRKDTNGVTRWSYAAPEGKHDDFVAAVLYATYGLPLKADGRKVQHERAAFDPSHRFTPRILQKIVGAITRNPYRARPEGC